MLGLKQKGRRKREREKRKERQRRVFSWVGWGQGSRVWDTMVVWVQKRQVDAGARPEPSLPASWPLQVSVYMNQCAGH